MHFRSIDRASADGLLALAQLETQQGPALAQMARDLDRLFLLGSPWAPGLWFVGGQTSAEAYGAAGGFSVAGAGVTFEHALAACCGEAIERTALIERAGDIVATAPIAATALDAVTMMATRVLATSGHPQDTAVDWVTAEDLASGAPVRLPADWCLRRPMPGALAIPELAQSTGSAAGRTAEAAKTSALLELVERDAAALWWSGGRPARRMDLDDPALAELPALIEALRQGETGRRLRLLEITTDVGIPVVAAVSTDVQGGAFACGLGCRLTLLAAARAAVLEVMQTEIGLQFALAKAGQLGEAALSDGDRRHIQRGETVRVKAAAVYTSPARAPRLATADAPLASLRLTLAQAGVDAALLDLTRDAVPVVKAVAPQLQHYPGNDLTDRLIRARAEFGGAAHWTGAVPLF
jgi:ribosomal protein S12 methylthiotransferase accessory factor